MQTMKALFSIIHWFTALLLPLVSIAWSYLTLRMANTPQHDTRTGEQTCLKCGRSRPGRDAQP